jgi:hypothetical protein
MIYRKTYDNVSKQHNMVQIQNFVHTRRAAVKNTEDEKIQLVGETSESKRQTLEWRDRRDLRVQMGRLDRLEWEQKREKQDTIDVSACQNHSRIRSGSGQVRRKNRAVYRHPVWFWKSLSG